MKNSINDLFNHHFEKDTQDKNNTVGSIIKMKGLMNSPTHEQKDLATHFKSIKKLYLTILEFYTTEDMIQSYATAFLFASYRLEELESLEYLLDNPEVYQSRISYIKEYINHEFHEIANPNIQKVKTRGGDKYIDNSATSLDTPVGQGEDATTLVNLISDENSIFKQTESHHNPFVQWFLDNREQILTKKQLTTFETFKDIYQPKAGNTKEDNAQRQLMLQDANLNNRNMKLIFKRIKDSVTDAYEKEFNGVYHSHSYTDRKGLYIVRGVNGIILISHKVLRKVNNNIIKEEISNHKPLMIEANYPEFEYNENPFAGLSKLPQSNLVITTSGTVTAKDNLQIS